MQYTESIVDCLKGLAQEHREAIDWQSACEQVKDPRRNQGKRFSITSILLLALAAILSNHLSELAIAEWGAGQSDEIKKALGFENGVTPHQTTIQRLFRRVKAEDVETAFRHIFLQLVNSKNEKRGDCAVSIGGKAQRGKLKFEEKNGYRVHAVSLVDHQTGIVLTQGHVEKADVERTGEPTDVKTTSKLSEEQEQEEKKERSELAVASRLIAHIDWKGKVLAGDALYCQRCVCSALRASRRGLSVSGEGKPASTPGRSARARRLHSHRQNEQVRGFCAYLSNTLKRRRRRMGVWTCEVFGCLQNGSGYSDWPGLEQVLEIHRCWQSKGIWKEAVRYGVTSLPALDAIPERVRHRSNEAIGSLKTLYITSKM
jgi:hypothetical protein